MDAPADPARDHQEGQTFVLDHMATWIELFYDLVFVAAILIFTSGVQHVHPASAAGWIVLVFAATWWVWFTTTACANRFHMSDMPHRILLLCQMLVIVLMAMEARVSVSGDSSTLAVEYGILLLTLALVAFRGYRQGGPDAEYAKRLAQLNAGSAACFFVAVFLSESWRLTVGAVVMIGLVSLSIVLFHHTKELSEGEEEHFVERMGAFTLIVFGESFIKVAITVGDGTIHKVDVLSLVFDFVLVFALFASYFEDIPAAGLNQRRFGWWAGLNLIAQICIAGIAVSASRLTDLRISRRLPDVEILKLLVPLAVLYLALAGIGACTRRRPIGPLATARLGTAAMIVVVGLLAWSIPGIHMVEALPMFTVVAIIHVFVVMRLRDQTVLVEASSLTVV
ncbi:MAG: low temperature requirement protein A [Acidimicrobiales bacterium]